MKNAALLCLKGLCLISLTACGGSGGGGGDDEEPMVEPRPSYAELEEQRNALVELVDAAGSVPSRDIPETGSATFDGVVMMNVEKTGTMLLGDMQITTNFENDNVFGSVSNVVDADEDEYTGSLDIVGEIERSRNGRQVDADLSGTLTDPNNRPFAVEAEFNGNYAGSDFGFIEGSLEGEVRASDLPQGVSDIDGDFEAERVADN